MENGGSLYGEVQLNRFRHVWRLEGRGCPCMMVQVNKSEGDLCMVRAVDRGWRCG